jgi:hypothetical protein
VSSNGVERLRNKRGDQEVTFSDVADHLDDFVNSDPDSRETIDKLASFIAGVEDVDHQHQGGSGGSTTSEGSVVRPNREEESTLDR